MAIELSSETDRNKKVRLQKKLDRFKANVEKEVKPLNNDMYRWYANIWGQGKEIIEAEQVRQLAETSQEQDDGVFWAWITKETQAMILLHRNNHLKN